MSEETIGILLAGGRSSRMGGGDKSLTTLGGMPMLAHVTQCLAPQCTALILSANGAPERFSAFGLPVLADDVEGFAGPLAGILAGLDFIAAHHPAIAWALSAATDTPFLPRALVQRLHQARAAADARIACARSGGNVHPVVALWPVALRQELRHALTVETIRKVDRFAARYPRAFADWDADPLDPFFNVNTPADLAEAERLWAAK